MAIEAPNFKPKTPRVVEKQPVRLDYIALGKEIKEEIGKSGMSGSQTNQEFMSVCKGLGIYFTTQELSSILEVKEGSVSKLRNNLARGRF